MSALAAPTLARRYEDAARGVAVYSAHASRGRRLRLHAAEVEPAVQAALLRLDPIDDREEYAALAELLSNENTPTIESLTHSDRPEIHRLGLRVRNLGVDRFSVWAPGERGSVLDAVHDQSIRCVVIDLGSLPTREEQSLVAAVVLGDLWTRRQERKPVLIVIDEAHNVCPAEPPHLLVTAAADHAIRIAAEGRKFGLYLLVSTQRVERPRLPVPAHPARRMRGTGGRVLGDVAIKPGQGRTCITFSVRDDSELYGVLDRIQDLALHLISLHEINRTKW